MESQFSDSQYYRELVYGIQDFNNMFAQLSILEISKIVPNYTQKKLLDEYVPMKEMWAYLREIWIKSDCKFMAYVGEKKKELVKKGGL